MRSLKDLMSAKRRGPSDLLGLDLGTTGAKAVRVHRSGESITIQAADVFAPVDLDAVQGEGALPAPVVVPARLKARQACLVIPGRQAVIKLLSFPGHFEAQDGSQRVVDGLGLSDPSKYRIAYKVTHEGAVRSGSESRVLAAAVREEEAHRAAMLLPAGLPVPHTIEVAGIAAMSAFLAGIGDDLPSRTVGMIEFGATMSHFALFHRGSLSLFRRFDFGVDRVLKNLSKTLGVDETTAAGIMVNGSFDVSHTIDETLGPILKQLVVSRDFVERRENCRLETVYACGGLALSHDVLETIRASVGNDVKPWSPVDAFGFAAGAIPDTLEGAEWRLTAAIGACLGAMEEA